MGKFLPVCSGAGIKLMPSPAPESILVSVASCGTDASLKSIQTLLEMANAKKVFLDNGMFTFFRKWEKGKRVIFDNARTLYPGKGVAMNLTAVHAIQVAMVLKPTVLIVTDLPVPRIRSTK